MTPVFSGEVQFAGFTDSSRGGPVIKLRLQDRDDLQKFIGLEARRFMGALVLLSDDEQPEAPPPSAAKEPAPEKPRGGALAKLAGVWCQKPEFVEWLKTVYPAAFWSAEKTHKPDPETAAQVIRVMCEVKSRADLDNDEKAAARFDRAFRKPFSKYLQDGS